MEEAKREAELLAPAMPQLYHPPARRAPPAPAPALTVQEERVGEFRRLQAHFPALEEGDRSIALLVAQGYDAGAIAGDLRIKRFDVFQAFDRIGEQLRRAEAANPTPAPLLPEPIRRPFVERDVRQAAAELRRHALKPDGEGFIHIPVGRLDPKPTHEDPEEPEIVEDTSPNSAQKVRHPRTELKNQEPKPQLAKVVRRCRRCHQPGHRTDGCHADLTGARLQDIAAACARLGLTPAAPPRTPLPVAPPAPEPPAPPERTVVDWEVLEGWEEEFGPYPDPAPPARPAPPEELAPPAPMIEPGAAGAPPPAIAAIRRRMTTGQDDRVRGKTIAPRRLTRDEVRESAVVEHPDEVLKPITRGECHADPGRPCPWVSCKAHNYLEVNEDTGAIKLNFPHLEVWEIPETCSLDVADRGETTLEEVGRILNVTRERVRQVETQGLVTLQKKKDRYGLSLPVERADD